MPGRFYLFLGGPVKFVQYYLDCLSQASYLVGDES